MEHTTALLLDTAYTNGVSLGRGTFAS